MNVRLIRGSRCGAALMMVVVILALLLVLAVSFTFLMTQQEGTSVASLGGEQTRIITRTGADHAYARLSPRNRLNEFDRWYDLQPSDVTPGDNPFVDWQGEYAVDLLADLEGWGDQQALFPGLMDADGAPRFRVEDPRRRVLGMNLADESGKVNLNASTAGLIGNLIGSSWVSSNASATGGIYERIVLEDASFLDAYDHRDGASTRGGGYVVIDNQLFSYRSRRGNVLYNCVPNPGYHGAGSTNALFVWNSPGREVQTGEYVTTPTAYKIAFRSWLQSSDGATPALYNNLGHVRRIAEMDRWFAPNVALAPDVLGARLDGWPEGLNPVDYQWIQENATVIAPTLRFDRGWFYPHVVTQAGMTLMGESGLVILSLGYDDRQGIEPGMYVPDDPRRSRRWSGIGRGNLVRIRPFDGNDSILGWVLQSGGGYLQVCVRGEHGVDFDGTWIVEVAERARININSANFDALVALFHGVGPRGQSAESQPITRAAAEELASRILERTRDRDFTNEFEDLADLHSYLIELSQLDSPPIYSSQIDAFIQMQRHPYARLSGLVTAQVSFSSLDAYMVDSFATRYQPSGGAMARDAFREWVQIGSDAERTWRWYHYDMLESEQAAPQGNIMKLHPAGTVNDRTIGLVELPYLHYPGEQYRRQRGDRPWSQPQSRNLGSEFYSNAVAANSNVSGSTGQFGDLEAGMFNFWYRPQWGDLETNHYLFDVAEQEFSNRMSLLWWGDRRGAYNLSGRNSGLTYRIKDRTLEEAYVELRYEMDAATWRNREWRHMGLNWKGTELSHISLLLDGDSEATGGGQSIKPVVNHTFREINGAWVNRTSTLQDDLEDPRQSPMTQFEIRIDPDDIDAFPDEGVVVIGGEAIEYTGKTSFALVGINRGPPNPSVPGSATGARGTTAGFHADGSAVTVFGYTAPIREWQTSNNMNETWRPRFPHLPSTSGQLESSMGATAFKRVSKDGSNNASYYRPTELGPDAGFPGGGDAPLGGDPNHLPLNDYTGLPQQGIVTVVGLAWNGYHPPGTENSPDPTKSYPNWSAQAPAAPPARYPPPLIELRFEYVAYNGIGANGLNVVARYDASFNIKPASTWWHFLGEYSTDLFPSNPGNQVYTNRVNFWALGSVVMLVSIDVNNVAGYHNRSLVQIDEEWFFYNRVWDPGAPDADVSGATATGDDDHRFPALIYLSYTGMLARIHGAAANNAVPAPWAPWRGAMGTQVTGHNATSPVLPTFGTTVTAGDNDVVTVIAGKNNNKALRRIRVHRQLRAYANEFSGWAPANPPNENEYICALDNHVGVDYAPNPYPVTDSLNVLSNNWRGGGANLCKFPTGELPVELPTSWTFAGPDPRTRDAGSQGSGLNHSGDFDSFEFRQFSKGDFRLIQGMTANNPGEGGDVYVNASPTAQAGVIRVGAELIYYREVRQATISVWSPNLNGFQNQQVAVLGDITRGILGSPVQAHSGNAVFDAATRQVHGGTPVMNMASMRAGHTRTAGLARENRLNVVVAEEDFRAYGFVRIEDHGGGAGALTEVAGYQDYLTSGSNGTLVCGEFVDPSLPQGLFRGAYGTRALNYSDRALFIDQPVRFPDWFPGLHESAPGSYAPWHDQTRPMWGVPGAESPEISYFQGAAAFRHSVFKEFKWRIQYAPLADMGRHMDAIGARLVVRFKQRGQPMPEWGDIPTNAPGGLYSFEFNPNGFATEDLGSTLYEQTEDFTQGGNQAGVSAERIEWRVYFYFKQGAFVNEDYKTTLQFQGAEVTLKQITRVIRHEEKR